ncbi:MAG TPA: carbamoyltransferase HypF [Terriglobales bacterium]|nr:carbamoyltransferase HypF [Terriglobales bacterium]
MGRGRIGVDVRQRVEVSGVVQGVGFRPWVHRLAGECGLGGEVWNTSAGVTIEVEGEAGAVAEFVWRLRSQPPPLARIERTEMREVAGRGERGFAIGPSRGEGGSGARVGVDTAPCGRCRADYLDPGNRRHGYAFTNCTDCGPRYTITRALPYDRAQTTMAEFRQCGRCQEEYDAPGERRFHAQPNACAGCGPELRLGGWRGPEALAEAQRRLRAGAIVAVKNVGGYQLACDAANEEAVARLRQRKQRPAKPLALLARDLAVVERVCAVGEAERASLESRARPIVLLERRRSPEWGLAAGVAPGQRYLGVMLPSSPLHDLLLQGEGAAPPLLVMTSGNRGAEPIARTAEEAHARLEGIAEAYLEHDRGIHMRADDSVVFCWGGRERQVRRARGYVPEPIGLGGEGPPLLAAGAEMKSSFCLTRGGEAYLGPHLGEMENLETWAYFEQACAHAMELLGVKPEVLVCDAHPGYQVTAWARAWARGLGVKREMAVQHHHAHIAACMAEHGLQGAGWGVALDGSGQGADGTLWGGEFLWADRCGYVRAAHLRPVGLAGGERAVRQPWRVGLAYAQDAVGEAAGARAAAALWPGLGAGRVRQVQAVLRGSAPRCSSAGRLFDAVAALLGLAPEGEELSYEGQAAQALEQAAGEEAEPYGWALAEGMPAQLDMRPMIGALLADRLAGVGIQALAARFHATLAGAVVATLGWLRERHGGGRVCLGGGVFQNRRLLGETVAGLEREGWAVHVPARAPANDGGLALGQAAVAAARLARGEGTDVLGDSGQDRGRV